MVTKVPACTSIRGVYKANSASILLSWLKDYSGALFLFETPARASSIV